MWIHIKKKYKKKIKTLPWFAPFFPIKTQPLPSMYKPKFFYVLVQQTWDECEENQKQMMNSSNLGHLRNLFGFYTQQENTCSINRFRFHVTVSFISHSIQISCSPSLSDSTLSPKHEIKKEPFWREKTWNFTRKLWSWD